MSALSNSDLAKQNACDASLIGALLRHLTETGLIDPLALVEDLSVRDIPKGHELDDVRAGRELAMEILWGLYMDAEDRKRQKVALSTDPHCQPE